MSHDLHDFQILDNREPATYPGHPVTIAYCIVKNYDSYSDAVKPHHNKHGLSSYPDAISSYYIPGAGGNVRAGVDLLRRVVDEGMDVDEALSIAQDYWDTCEDQQRRYPQQHKDGQAQAEAHRDRLLEAIKTWGK